MAKKKELNDRCPLQGECEKTCTFAGHELDCPYYDNNSRPGFEIDDQEEKRRERWREGDFSYLDEDDPEDAESPSEAEKAAVMPSDTSDEVVPAPVEVLPASLHLDGSMGVTEKIKRAMYDAAKQFVYIGFLLYEVQSYEYHREKGYYNVYEYAEKELGFKKSSTKNFLAINYEFGCRDDRPHGIAHQRTMSLQPQYREFNYSQLCEMLSMSEKQREKVTPDMTVKQIRDLKRGEAEPDLPPNMETIPIALPDDPEPSGQTSGQFEPPSRIYYVNNACTEMTAGIVRRICFHAGIDFDIDSSYDITITLHRDT